MKKAIIRAGVSAMLLAIMLATTDLGSRAQVTNENFDTVLAEMTTRLVSMRPESGKGFARSEFEALAAERFEMLRAAASKDPASVLRYALPDDVLKTMPEEMRGFFEERADLEGELEVIAECEDHDGRTLFYVTHKGERTQLFFAKQPDLELLTGDRVSVHGVLIGDAMAVEQDGITAEAKGDLSTGGTESAITGEIKVLVFLVNFQNDTRTPYTQRSGEQPDVQRLQHLLRHKLLPRSFLRTSMGHRNDRRLVHATYGCGLQPIRHDGHTCSRGGCQCRCKHFGLYEAHVRLPKP
jgi:hypothetical protein